MARELVRIPDAPIGTVQAFAGGTIPSGWLLCNGASLSRTDYSLLFAAIGTNHGTASSTTFNLPDYRGRFLRGRDGGIGRDPDRASRFAMATGGLAGDNVGSIQGHAFQTHNHTQVSHNHGISPSVISDTNGTAQGPDANNDGTAVSVTSTVRPIINDTAASGPNAQATPNETRPLNANVNYIIKYI